MSKKMRKVTEDGEGAAAPAGDSGASAAGDAVVSPGTGVEDVLGKDCDHHKDGYLGPKCFHVPSRAGKVQKRIELPGKKKKSQKNLYAASAKLIVLNEDDDGEILDAIEELSECGLNESDESIVKESSMFTQLLQLRNSMKNPADLDKFMKDHWHEIEAYQKSGSTPQSKSIVSRAWECLKKAVASGFSFIMKHWKKILLAILVIAAIVFFKNTEAGTRFGNKLFGKGAQVAVAAKNATLKMANQLKKLVVTDGVAGSPEWIEVTDQHDASGDDVAVGIGNGLWQSALKATGETIIGVEDNGVTRWFKKAVVENEKEEKIDETELSRDMILNIHKISEESMRKFVLNEWGPQSRELLSDAIYIEAICYNPLLKCLFIKVNDAGNNRTMCCVADYDAAKKQLVSISADNSFVGDCMTMKEAKAEFKRIAAETKTNGIPTYTDAAADMKLWVIWGRI